jgi:hypothetical protein
MPNRTTKPATGPHDAPCIVVVTAIADLPHLAAAATLGRTAASASPVMRLGGGGGVPGMTKAVEVRYLADGELP